MQEQVYQLKNKLAVADDALKRRDDSPHSPARDPTKLIRKYETDLDELSSALRTYEHEQARWLHDLSFYQSRAKTLESRLVQAQTAAKDSEKACKAATEANEKFTLDINRGKDENFKLHSEIHRLKDRLATFEAVQTDFDGKITVKNEEIKAGERRLQHAVRKIEELERENEVLKKKITEGEEERRQIAGKWQK